MARLRAFSSRPTHRNGRFARCSFLLLLAVASSLATTTAFAIRDVEDPELADLRDGFDDAESDALTTLALADASLRDAVLDASANPDALARLSAIQERSSREFRARLEREERSTQRDAWELARYPELVDELVLGGRPTRGSIDDVIAPYPARIREIARGLALHHFSLVRDMATLREDAERENQQALSSLPLATQASFEALIERPDLLSAMLREPAVAARLGEMVRDDAWSARSVLDREHARLSEERERELDEWRDTIENDPEAARELRESAEQFANDEGYEDPGGYRDEYVDEYADGVGVGETRTEVHHYYHHPYPWWFGPPHWRVGWHWYPHRTHWGFHVSVGGGLVIHSLPTPIFSYWHYRRPASHRHHYRHLHRHWARYGSRHHLHRDYRHRVHHRKRHSYHQRRDGLHGGHRAKRIERRHSRSKRDPQHFERRRRDSTNKFFRHDSVRRRSTRDGALHRVVRDEPRKRERKRSDDRRRVSWRGDRKASPGDRIRAREPSRRDRDQRKTARRTNSSSRDRSTKTIARRDRDDGKRNRFTTRDRRSPGKKTSSSARPGSRSDRSRTNKFMRSSERSSGSKKSSARFSKDTRKRKASKIDSRKSSKKRKSSNRRSKTSSQSRKSVGKSGKKKGGGSSNKFFSRR